MLAIKGINLSWITYVKPFTTKKTLGLCQGRRLNGKRTKITEIKINQLGTYVELPNEVETMDYQNANWTTKQKNFSEEEKMFQMLSIASILAPTK